MVLRLHARQMRARRAVPSIVVCKTNASRPPQEFLLLSSALASQNIPAALKLGQASRAHRRYRRLPPRHQLELPDGLVHK